MSSFRIGKMDYEIYAYNYSKRGEIGMMWWNLELKKIRYTLI